MAVQKPACMPSVCPLGATTKRPAKYKKQDMEPRMEYLLWSFEAVGTGHDLAGVFLVRY